MPSLVLHLQRECMSRESSTSDILRRALVVATKLNVEEFRKLCEKELHGYKNEAEAPKYREIHGQIKVHNPYHGWQPVMFSDPKRARALSVRRVTQSISELEHLVKGSENAEGTLEMPFPPEILHQWSNEEFMQLGLVPTLLVSRAHIFGIIDTVRNLILEWSLKLEKDGILGEEMTFSPEEKKIAASVVYNIQSVTGIVGGDVSASSVQIGDYNSIHHQLKQAGVPQEERNELETIMDLIPTADPKKKKSLIKKGFDWINRNKATLGTLYGWMKTWLESQ